MKNSLPPSKKSTKLNPTPIARTEMINDNTKKSKGSLDRYSYAGNREAAKSVKEMQLEKNIRDLSSFRKRIRSYKTPF